MSVSQRLKAAFPHIIPAIRPPVLDQTIKNPHWLAGFVCGEGCFLVSVAKSTKFGYQVRCNFSISQHLRDSKLMESLVKYLSCGEFYQKLNNSYGEFIVSKFPDIESKIIPFFNKYPLHGDKAKD